MKSTHQMAKFVCLMRAQGPDVPIFTIHITVPAEEFKTIDAAREAFQRDGKTLASALFDSLPGGTIDALLVELMTRRASLFVVPFVAKDNGNS